MFTIYIYFFLSTKYFKILAAFIEPPPMPDSKGIFLLYLFDIFYLIVFFYLILLTS